MQFPRLDNLVKVGQLKAEPPSTSEIDGLLEGARVRLGDAESDGLALLSRFDLAYAAAHAFALVALRFHGYRSENRYVVFQTLEDTVKMPAAEWRVLDLAHRRRNQIEYGGKAVVEKAVVEELIRVARALETRVASLVE